jgi:hypothetical protein
VSVLDRANTIGITNRALELTAGLRLFVCSNIVFSGDLSPALAKHSKSFSLIDCVSVGVDGMQRAFERMRKQVEA